jgi:ribonuclease HI
MELMAINQALRHACKNTTQGDIVYIYSDSAYCINIFTQWISKWKANGWTRGKKHEPIENLDLIKEIDEMIFSLENSFIAVQWTKVNGHSNVKWNEYVDKLAVKAKESQVKT